MIYWNEIRTLLSWKVVSASFGYLINAYRFQPQTFNYNDFDRVNLALSLETHPPRAVVFDYDCFRLGSAFSDWRNVTYWLKGDALREFINYYGPVREVERVLDGPLSVLCGLVVASRREHVRVGLFCSWSRSKNSDLERDVRNPVIRFLDIKAKI